jgi:acetyl-CoA carboxylase biotin carboxyl carrier protein
LRQLGETLTAGSVFGELYRDERTFTLVLPHGITGQLHAIELRDPWTECGHGRPLAVLAPPVHEAESADASTTSEGDHDLWAVRSPTHGTFYRRPSPDEPNYVEAGDELHSGQILGLVEVMKSFSPITFTPPPGVEQGVVRRVVAHDGGEVRSDEVLIEIELR